MAGIGFELRKILSENRILSYLRIYGYSVILSSGAWIISLISIILIGYLNLVFHKRQDLSQFQIVITYIFSMSLVFSGFLQLFFIRFVADTIFEKKFNKIFPNLSGVLVLTMGTGFLFMFFLSFFILKNQNPMFVILFISAFSTLCGIWITNVFLIGLKKYKIVLLLYLFAYTAMVVLTILLEKFGIEGFIASFLIGNVLLLFGMVILIFQNYPSDYLIEFNFLSKEKVYLELLFIGFLYNLGMWIDKFIFWFHPWTSYSVVDLLRASMLYDPAIFLAYLSMIPGIAVLFYRIEVYFAEKYDSYYNSIREGESLNQIEINKDEMVVSIRETIFELIIMQSIFNIFIFLFAPNLFYLLKISDIYLNLFYIDLIGVELQLIFMSVLGIMFYMSMLRPIFLLVSTFVVLNTVFSYISIRLGVNFIGYGFASSLLIVLMPSLIMLKKHIENLNYETFMLQ